MARVADQLDSDLEAALRASLELSQQTESKQKNEDTKAQAELARAIVLSEQTAAAERERREGRTRRSVEENIEGNAAAGDKAERTQHNPSRVSKESLNKETLYKAIVLKKQESLALSDKIIKLNAKINVAKRSLTFDENYNDKNNKPRVKTLENALQRSQEVYNWAQENLTLPDSIAKYKNEYESDLHRYQLARDHLDTRLREIQNQRTTLEIDQDDLLALRMEEDILNSEIAQLQKQWSLLQAKEDQIRDAELKRQQAEREERARVEAQTEAETSRVQAEARRAQEEQEARVRAENEARTRAENDAKAAAEQIAREEKERTAIEQIPTLIESLRLDTQKNQAMLDNLTPLQQDLKQLIETKDILAWLDEHPELTPEAEQQKCKEYVRENLFEQSDKLKKEAETLLLQAKERARASARELVIAMDYKSAILKDETAKATLGDAIRVNMNSDGINNIETAMTTITALLKQLPSPPAPYDDLVLYVSVNSSAAADRAKEDARRRAEEERKQQQERTRYLEALWRQHYLEACRVKAEKEKKAAEERQRHEQQERERTILRQREIQRLRELEIAEALALERAEEERRRASQPRRVVQYNYA